MGVYSKTVLESPNTVNISSSYSANQFTTNNGQTKAYNGMPGKDGVADHGTTFVLGRRVYSSYRKPDNIMTLEQLYKNQNFTTNIRYKQTSNSLIKSTQVEIGKPIADNSSGLYVNRRKHLAIQRQHPHLDIRFVFTNSRSKLRKGAKSSYGQWCDKYGFRYYDRIIPEDWLKEKGKNKHPNFIKFSGTKVKRRKSLRGKLS